MQGDAAFRRWATGLSDLKRARDQLRHPVEVLSAIATDAAELTEQTSLLAAPVAAETDDEAQPAQRAKPAWLTSKFVADQQSSVLERVQELLEAFQQINASQQQQRESTSDAAADQSEDPQTEFLLQNIAAATPLVDQAAQRYEQAAARLEQDALQDAFSEQTAGLEKLGEALELFLDLRRLIEMIYVNQLDTRQELEQSIADPSTLAALKAPLLDTHDANLKRCRRLADLLQLERNQLPAAAESSSAAAGTAGADDQPQESAALRARLDVADALLQDVVDALTEARQQVQMAQESPESEAARSPDRPAGSAAPQDNPAAKQPAPTEPPEQDSVPSTQDAADDPPEPAAADTPLQQALAATNRSIAALEELRRLFFSLVEHLRDTAQRQANVLDETTRLAADPQLREQPEEVGPLAVSQQQLQSIASQLTEAFEQQAQQATAAASQAPQGTGPDQAASPQEAQQAAEKFNQAAALIKHAEQSMQAAATRLAAVAEATVQDECAARACSDQPNRVTPEALGGLGLV